MAHKIPLDNLLRLLEINGEGANAQERALIIEKIIDDVYPGYKQELFVRFPLDKLIFKALAEWKHSDLKIVPDLKGGKHVKVSYHVNAGCSGDWGEEYVCTYFLFLHQVLGFKNHT
jgi:hypothetical protein